MPLADRESATRTCGEILGSSVRSAWPRARQSARVSSRCRSHVPGLAAFTILARRHRSVVPMAAQLRSPASLHRGTSLPLCYQPPPFLQECPDDRNRWSQYLKGHHPSEYRGRADRARRLKAVRMVRWTRSPGHGRVPGEPRIPPRNAECARRRSRRSRRWSRRWSAVRLRTEGLGSRRAQNTASTVGESSSMLRAHDRELTVMKTGSRVDLGLLVIRIGLGATMFAHGSQKLFGWFGGHGVKGTAAGMEHMGYRPPRISAVAAGLGEAGGGALLGLGLATPLGGPLSQPPWLRPPQYTLQQGSSPLKEVWSTRLDWPSRERHWRSVGRDGTPWTRRSVSD